MNKTAREAVKFIDALTDYLNNKKSISHHILIAPSTIHLPILSKSLSKSFNLAAQNIAFKDAGAYTGEVSAKMLSEYVQYSIVGHSERRCYFNEDHQILYQKLVMCLQHNITPIFCIGENKNDRDANNYLTIIQQQLNETLMLLDDDDLLKTIVAYEPVWAIGSGNAASLDQISELHTYIRSILFQRLGEKSNDIPILYGGSCNSSNTQSILTQNNVDGLLVGGASLDVVHFQKMIDMLDV
tara:strand:+ start:1126 stop:1848 length:723 start_codon:yes stop_codon:yes gene_type:complete